MIIFGNGALGTDLKRVAKSNSVFDAQFTRENFDFMSSPVEDFIRLMEKVKTKDKFVVNTAAYTDVSKSEKEQHRALVANALGPPTIAAACKELGFRFMHISTDYVFDGTKDLAFPYTENCKVNPLGWYGMTKLMGEEKVISADEKNIVVRTAELYSHDSGYLPNMVKYFKSKKLVRGATDQFVAPTHVRDLSKQIIKIYENRDKVSGIIHASAEGHTTPYDVFKLISEYVKANTKINRTTLDNLYKNNIRPKMCLMAKSKLEDLELNIMPSWHNSAISYLKSL